MWTASKQITDVDSEELHGKSWKHLTVPKRMRSGTFKNNVTNNLFVYKSSNTYMNRIYMYE